MLLCIINLIILVINKKIVSLIVKNKNVSWMLWMIFILRKDSPFFQISYKKIVKI